MEPEAEKLIVESLNVNYVDMCELNFIFPLYLYMQVVLADDASTLHPEHGRVPDALSLS